MIGIFGLNDLRGRTLRAVVSSSRSIDEKFMVDFSVELPADRLLPFHGRTARLEDTRAFEEIPGPGVTLLYRSPLAADVARAEVIAAFDSQVVPDSVADAAIVDLSTAKPESGDDFWRVMEQLSRVVTPDSVDDFVAEVSSLTRQRLLAFSSSFFSLLSRVSTPEILARHPQVGPFPGDAFLWWRLAVIASGRDVTEHVLSGGVADIDEESIAAAEDLVDVCERAWEIRTGVRPTFTHGDIPPAATAAQWEYTGERSFQAMIDDDRFPQIVGSRFLVELDGQMSDCVAIQYVDVDSENRDAVLSELAREVAARLGGTIPSRVFGSNTYTGRLFDGLGVFRSKRPASSRLL